METRTDTRKWKATGTPGVYKQLNARGVERFRVLYEAREVDGGKTVVKQRSQVFAAPKGKRIHRITVGTDSELVTAYEAACHFKGEKDAARKAGRVTDHVAAEMTLGDFWPRYLDRPTKRGARRESTRDTITRSYENHIAPTFGNTPLRAIRPNDVDTWYHGLKAGDAAKKKAASTLRAIFAVAMKLGLTEGNPVVVLDLPSDNVRAIDVEEVLTDEQIEKLKGAIDDRYRLMIDLLAEGLRIGEVVGLLRSDLNLKGDVTIRHNLVEVSGRMVAGPLKTENSYRTLPLGHLRDVIQRHLGEYSQPGADGYVFTGPDGSAPIQTSNWRKRAFYPALEAAELPKTVPHALRHRVAWDLIDRGFTVDQVADWIGDTPQTVRAVYANHPKIRSKAEIAAHRAERYREANGAT
jgi:integrase